MLSYRQYECLSSVEWYILKSSVKRNNERDEREIVLNIFIHIYRMLKQGLDKARVVKSLVNKTSIPWTPCIKILSVLIFTNLKYQ